ncbi:portal protein [Vibrio phage 2.096.O._10N.286.48.B5]|nr:portal protein [Vibrio phage 2.096.O._10N.286.48.B5]
MNLLDKVINYVSPEMGLARLKQRSLHGIIESRGYDANDKGRRNGGWFRPKSNAESEVVANYQGLADAGQELCRNNPLAHHAKMIWAANIVGAGVRAELSSSSKRNRERVNSDFDKWANSVDCDFEGQYNFYGLQWLVASTIVESGGAFIRQHINNDVAGVPMQLQVLEQSMLDSSKTTSGGSEIRNGIQYNDVGQIEGYWLYSESDASVKTVRVSKFYKRGTEVIHIFRKERAGQPLGVSWFTASANDLNNLSLLKEAKLTQAQILSCMAVIIEEATSPMGIGSEKDTSGMNVDSIEPAMIEYVKAGTKVHTVTPPSSNDNGLFASSVKDDIAIGIGLSSTQLTGDYSKLNFASGRMSKIEFFQTLDYAQLSMLQPALDQIFNWYSKIYLLHSNIRSQLSVEWTFPPRGVVQPNEELDFNIKKTRVGIMSPSKLNKMYGTNLSDVVAQWKVDKVTWDGLSFDVNPELFSAAGNQLNDDDAASSNNGVSNSTDDVDSGGDNE